MSNSGELTEVWTDVSAFSLQSLNTILYCVERVRNKVFAAREDARLVTREDDDVAALHEVIDPRAVIKRVGATPAMNKNNNGSRGWFWPVRFVNPVFFPALAVSILDDRGMRRLFSTGARVGLRWRGRYLRDRPQRQDQ